MDTLKPQSNSPHRPLIAAGCYIWYSEEGPGRAAALLSPLLAVPNVTAHLSTASVPITYHHIQQYGDWYTGLAALLSPLLAVPNVTALISTASVPITKYSNMVIGTLAVDRWAVTFGTARRGLGGQRPCSVPSSLYQMYKCLCTERVSG